MNWLLYIGGWLPGWAVFNAIISYQDKTNSTFGVWVKMTSWTMIWIWICWRFVA